MTAAAAGPGAEAEAGRAAGDALPPGVLVAWYGDDFTGSAAVMEVLDFAGLPAVLFLGVPTPAQLGRFRGRRAVGIAGTARAHGPAWMDRHLPVAFAALAGLEAPIRHYKVCSTLDSSPSVGSIGRAVEIARPILADGLPDRAWHPVVVGAPAIRRWQAFGTLFAEADGSVHRLDRHPTMSRHPVTPMTEADIGRHLSRQTALATGVVDLVAMKRGEGDAALERARAAGAALIALDVVDDETLAEAGRLVWRHRGEGGLCVGSQGLEYALIAHWRAAGLLPERPAAPAAPAVDRIAVVSGSCAPVTAAQIAWARDNGFRAIRMDAAAAVDAAAWQREIGRMVEASRTALSEGDSPLVLTAEGPDDPAIARLRTAVEAAGAAAEDVNRAIGEGLGRVLDGVLRPTAAASGAASGVGRAVIAGGDTSGYGAAALGLYALTARAPVVPGAALFTGHGDDPRHDGLEIALKGGQMGPPDYFGRIRQGGGDTLTAAAPAMAAVR